MTKNDYLAQIEETYGSGKRASLAEMNSASLREYAKEVGVKRAANDTKASLLAKLQDWHERQFDLLTSEEYMALVDVIEPETKTAKRATAGTSRAGMKINVPLRATGEAKAEIVRKRINQPQASRVITYLSETGGAMLTVTLVGVTLRLVWDADGRYDYKKSSAVLDGHKRKIRNVSEALRIVGA